MRGSSCTVRTASPMTAAGSTLEQSTRGVQLKSEPQRNRQPGKSLGAAPRDAGHASHMLLQAWELSPPQLASGWQAKILQGADAEDVHTLRY